MRLAPRGQSPIRTGHFTGHQCSHCGAPQIGMSSVTDGHGYHPLCHPDYGMDCYRLVTVYRHPMPCDCRGSSAHPDNDVCCRCEYRRFEHDIDPAEPRRMDFLGNPVPCWDFLERSMRDPFAQDVVDELGA